MRSAVLLTVLALLAGCASPEEDPQTPTAAPSPSSTVPDEAATEGDPAVIETRRINHTYSFEATSRGMTGPDPPENCAFLLVEEGGQIHDGRADATWEADSPLSDRLRLASGRGSGAVLVERIGPSVLSIEIPEFRHGDYPYVVIEAPVGTALTASQAVQIYIELDVSGSVELGGSGSCGT